MKIDYTITIHAPKEKVFSVFSDLDGLADRIKGIKSIEVLEGNHQMHVGTKWRETRIMFGKEATEVMWVTEQVQNERYVVEAESHGTHYRSEYVFDEVPNGTQVAMTFEGTPLSFGAKVMSVMFIFFAGATKKLLQQDMADLKEYIEKN